MTELTRLMQIHTITVVSPEGDRQENVRCQFSPPKVLVPDEKLDVAEGYRIERPLPNGRLEHYVVDDVQFTPALFGATPAHYLLRVRKASAPPRHASGPKIIYNVSGQNARVNINSSDASVNIAQVEVETLFQQMISAATAVPEPEVRQAVVAAIHDMEEQAGSPGFAAAYQRFIASVADHLTVFAPFLPALAQLLVD